MPPTAPITLYEGITARKIPPLIEFQIIYLTGFKIQWLSHSYRKSFSARQL